MKNVPKPKLIQQENSDITINSDGSQNVSKIARRQWDTPLIPKLQRNRLGGGESSQDNFTITVFFKEIKLKKFYVVELFFSHSSIQYQMIKTKHQKQEVMAPLINTPTCLEMPFSSYNNIKVPQIIRGIIARKL